MLVVGRTRVNSSWAFEGLLKTLGGVCFNCTGVVRGEATALLAAVFDGVGRYGSLTVGVWPGLVLGTVRFGEGAMAFGVTAFDLSLSGGLDCSAEG